MVFRLQRKETVPQGVRRLVGQQLDQALGHLAAEDGSADKQVHEARKCMKRLRALVRLVQGELGREVFTREDQCFRLAAKSLAGMRDATVLVQTFAGLAQLGNTGQRFDPVAQWLDQRRQEAYQGGEGPPQIPVRQSVVGALQWARLRLQYWPLQSRGWGALKGGLVGVYSRGYGEFNQVFQQVDDHALHDWRKRVKYLWFHCQILEGIWPEVMRATGDKLDQLGEALGDDHDLSVLQGTLRLEYPADIGRALRREIEELIGRRRRQLQRRAQRLGHWVYVEEPAALARRWRGYWRAWKIN